MRRAPVRDGVGMNRIAAVLSLLLLTEACGTANGSAAAPVTVKGDVLTRGSNTVGNVQTGVGYATAGATCNGYAGFSDLTSGSPVTVYDATGKIVALGKLADGTSPDGVSCLFPFSVADVPDGQFYSVEVSHRGKMQVTAQDARGGNVHLSVVSR